MELMKIDLVKTDPNYYKVGKNPDIREIPPCNYLAIQGKSAPEDQIFLDAISTIYAAAFGIKFLCKGEDNDFTVPKMEGFWYVEGGLEAQRLFTKTPRDQWLWKIMIRMPDFVDGSYLSRALENIRTGKKEVPSLEQLTFETIPRGKFAQILHLGSYEAEEPTLGRLFEHIREQGLTVNGHHREIYLTDPRRVPEDRLKTILRYSVI